MLLRMPPSHMGKLISRTISTPKIFYIYEGEMPTVDKDFIFNPANFLERQLAKISQGVLSVPSMLVLQWSGPASQFTPTKTGTASWFAMPLTDNAVGWPQVIFGTVTNDPNSKHPLLLSAIDLVAGEPQSCIDFSIKLGA